MAAVQLSALIDLVKFDQRFNSLNSLIRAHEHEIAKIEKELLNIEASNADMKRRFINAKKLVDEHELKMKDLQVVEKQKKEFLDRVENQKEYAAIKKEISQIQSEQQTHEKILLDAWNKLENLEKEQHAFLEGSEKKRAELTHSREEVVSKIESLRQEYSTHMHQRANMEKNVPQEWLDKYFLMRERVVDPVVPVIQGNCSSCFYAVPSQDVGIIRRGKLVQCKDCYRLLYLEPN